MEEDEISMKEGRQPTFYEADVMRRFGNVRYRCSATSFSWFHVIKGENWYGYIEEFKDEIIGIVHKNGVWAGCGAETFAEVFDFVDSKRNVA